MRGWIFTLISGFFVAAAFFHSVSIDFRNSISTPEELAQPEIEHPKEAFDYLFEAPLYIFIVLAIFFFWKSIRFFIQRYVKRG